MFEDEDEEYYDYVRLLSLPEYMGYIKPYKPEICGMSEYAKRNVKKSLNIMTGGLMILR